MGKAWGIELFGPEATIVSKAGPSPPFLFGSLIWISSFIWEEAVTFGRFIASAFARSKGASLGILSSEEAGSSRANTNRGNASRIVLMGTPIPVQRKDGHLQAIDG